jgi:hypothetical protein
VWARRALSGRKRRSPARAGSSSTWTWSSATARTRCAGTLNTRAARAVLRAWWCLAAAAHPHRGDSPWDELSYRPGNGFLLAPSSPWTAKSFIHHPCVFPRDSL